MTMIFNVFNLLMFYFIYLFFSVAEEETIFNKYLTLVKIKLRFNKFKVDLKNIFIYL